MSVKMINLLAFCYSFFVTDFFYFREFIFHILVRNEQLLSVPIVDMI